MKDEEVFCEIEIVVPHIVIREPRFHLCVDIIHEAIKGMPLPLPGHVPKVGGNLSRRRKKHLRDVSLRVLKGDFQFAIIGKVVLYECQLVSIQIGKRVEMLIVGREK